MSVEYKRPLISPSLEEKFIILKTYQKSCSSQNLSGIFDTFLLKNFILKGEFSLIYPRIFDKFQCYPAKNVAAPIIAWESRFVPMELAFVRREPTSEERSVPFGGRVSRQKISIFDENGVSIPYQVSCSLVEPSGLIFVENQTKA